MLALDGKKNLEGCSRKQTEVMKTKLWAFLGTKLHLPRYANLGPDFSPFFSSLSSFSQAFGIITVFPSTYPILEFLPSSCCRLSTIPRSRTTHSHQLWLKGRLQLETQRGAWGRETQRGTISSTPNFLKVQSQGKDRSSLKSPQAKAGEGDLNTGLYCDSREHCRPLRVPTGLLLLSPTGINRASLPIWLEYGLSLLGKKGR